MRTTSINLWKKTLSRGLRVALGLLLVFTSLAVQAVNESDLLSPEKAFPLAVTLSAQNEVALDFNTQPGYYLYRDRFSFAVDGTPIKPREMPPGEPKNDPTFGMVTVYHGPIRVRLPLPRCVFRGSWTRVSREGGQVFRAKLDSRSAATQGFSVFTLTAGFRSN
jgi:thiol:disulfide interchange protein DsbD